MSRCRPETFSFLLMKQKGWGDRVASSRWKAVTVCEAVNRTELTQKSQRLPVVAKLFFIFLWYSDMKGSDFLLKTAHLSTLIFLLVSIKIYISTPTWAAGNDPTNRIAYIPINSFCNAYSIVLHADCHTKKYTNIYCTYNVRGKKDLVWHKSRLEWVS